MNFEHYEEEMIQRDKILLKARNGERLTKDERLWLTTHMVPNRKMGFPYINSDIMRLDSSCNYCVRVKLENLMYPGRIIPVISVPGGKGKIALDRPVVDYNGNISSGKPIKMLGVLLDGDCKESIFTYQSSLGLLGVAYECDFYDDMQNIMIRKNSCTGDPRFAMLSEVLSENKMLYKCKLPTCDSFDSFIFSIEWDIKQKNS